MVALDFVIDRISGGPDPKTAKAFSARALNNGIVFLTCGAHGNTIRILAPLTAPMSIVEEGLDIIEKSLVDLAFAPLSPADPHVT